MKQLIQFHESRLICGAMEYSFSNKMVKIFYNITLLTYALITELVVFAKIFEI